MAIERRGGDRPWLARVYVNGERGPSRAFHTRHEAEAWEAIARSAMMRGEGVPRGKASIERVTVLQACRDATKAMLAGAMRTNTGQQYRRASVDAMEARLRLHVVPRIGGMLVADLERATVIVLREDILLASSPATASEAIKALRVVLRRCVDRGVIAVNPASNLPPMSVPNGDPMFLTVEQARALQERADAHPNPKIGLFVAVGLGTGMRRGELEALRWENVGRGVINVEQARDRYGEDGVPKTPKSVRPITIGPALSARLEAARGVGLVFDRAPREAWEAVRPPGMRIHDLRHTAATFWLAGGMNVHEVADLLGHTTAMLVLRRYGHALPSRLSRAGEVMESMLSGGAPGGAGEQN